MSTIFIIIYSFFSGRRQANSSIWRVTTKSLKPAKHASRIDSDLKIICTLPFDFVSTDRTQFDTFSPELILKFEWRARKASCLPIWIPMTSVQLKWSLFNSPADLSVENRGDRRGLVSLFTAVIITIKWKGGEREMMYFVLKIERKCNRLKEVKRGN